MLNYLERQLLSRQRAPLHEKARRGVRATIDYGRRKLGLIAERVGIIDDLSNEKVTGIIALPVERRLAMQLRGNEAAFQRVAEMLDVAWESGGSALYRQSTELYEAYHATEFGMSDRETSSDSLSGYRRIKVGGNKEVVVELCSAHNSMHFPSKIEDPQREKIVAFQGMDLALANAFDPQNGSGSRYDRLHFRIQADKDELLKLKDMQATIDLRPNGVPVGIEEIIDALPKEEGGGLPVGLSLFWISNHSDRATMIEVLPHTKPAKHIPRLCIVTAKEDGNLVDIFERMRRSGDRVEVLVKKDHVPLVRNFMRPERGFHVVERSRSGRPLRFDGKEINFEGEIARVPNSYNVVIKPLDDNVDREVRLARELGGKRDVTIGVDIVESGSSIDKHKLNAPLVIMPAQLVAVRSLYCPLPVANLS